MKKTISLFLTLLCASLWIDLVRNNAQALEITYSKMYNILGGAANQIPYQTGAGATGFIAAPGANVVLWGNSGAPSWTNSPVLGGALGVGGATLSNGTLVVVSTSAVAGTDILRVVKNDGTTNVFEVAQSGAVTSSTMTVSGSLTVNALLTARTGITVLDLNGGATQIGPFNTNGNTVYPTTDNYTSLGGLGNRWLDGHFSEYLRVGVSNISCTTCTIHSINIVATGSLSQGDTLNCTLGLKSDATGKISGCVASDARLKNDVLPLKYDGGKIIDGLRPVRFKWKDTGRLDRGFIAQDVQKIDPDAISPAGKDLLGIDANALTAEVVMELKELRKRVKALEKK